MVRNYDLLIFLSRALGPFIYKVEGGSTGCILYFKFPSKKNFEWKSENKTSDTTCIIVASGYLWKEARVWKKAYKESPRNMPYPSPISFEQSMKHALRL